MAEHTPEPWSYYETRIYEKWGTGRYIANNIEWPRFPDEAEANARRIVACVNFCAGVSTEWLEHHNISECNLGYESALKEVITR